MSCLRRATMSVAATALLSATPAGANGRFPASTNVEAHPANDDTLLLPLTFGLLISTDRGASFRWVCEEAIGYGGEYDPDYELSSGGTMYAGVFDALRVSRDGGCTWSDAPAPLAGHWVASVALGDDGRVWAATASTSMANDVFVSDDDGTSFAASNLETANGWWRSIQVAPGDPDRIYVSGYSVAGEDGPAAMLRRSDDGGDTWTELPVAGIRFGQVKLGFFEAVSPTNPDVVYLRALGAEPPTGDALYRSDDAGESFTEVLVANDTITAFVARADGHTIIAATKSPCAGDSRDAGFKGCVQISADRGQTWARPAQEPVMGCITERADGTLLACGANYAPDYFALGRSSDGQQWDEVLQFKDIAAPVACEPGTVQRDTCEALKWPSIRDQFDIARVDAGPSVPPKNPEGCGCSVGFAAALLVVPSRRRRHGR